MSVVRIQTAQNVALEFETASVGDRLLAQLLDWLVMILWSLVVGFLIDQATNSGDEQNILGIVIIGVPLLVYHPVCEIFFNGQSLGKHLRHIKVTRLDGTRPSLGDYLLRWLIGLFEISMTAGSVALLAVLLSGRGQRLGDLAAGTTVVSLRAPANPDYDLLKPLGAAEYRVTFPEAGLLPDHDAALVRQLLHQAVRRENYLLLNEVANKVKVLIQIQTDMQDEPFLRTVLLDHAHLAGQRA
ncbi:RDD family protein [Hymenobacter koreensis]